MNITQKDIFEFADTYVEAALLTDLPEDAPSDPTLSKAFKRACLADCKQFISRISHVRFPITVAVDQVAHDFWLTRNGHGCGFWGRPEIYGEELSTELTTLAHSFGERFIYVSDRGKLEIS